MMGNDFAGTVAPDLHCKNGAFNLAAVDCFSIITRASNCMANSMAAARDSRVLTFLTPTEERYIPV